MAIASTFLAAACASAQLHDGFESSDLTAGWVQLVWTQVNVNSHDSGKQGDAHLLQVPGGRTALIDAGHERAASNLVDALIDRGIDHIDVAFVTHAHKDHYGGLVPALDAGIAIGAVVWNLPEQAVCDSEIPWGCHYDHVLAERAELQARGVPLLEAQRGDVHNLGHDVTATVLYAYDGVDTPVGGTGINDTSLIVRVDTGHRRLLFTGDLNQALGAWLALEAPDGELQADVLKMPHHGTRSHAPDEFFDRVDPAYALVPSPKSLWCSSRSDAVRTWATSRHVPVYVDGDQGHIEVTVAGPNLTIRAERPGLGCPF